MGGNRVHQRSGAENRLRLVAGRQQCACRLHKPALGRGALHRRFPLAHVREIHLAGHTREIDDKGRPLLIDTHDKFVDQPVWNLFRRVIKRTGPIPTLIEWDANIPPWHELAAEAGMADVLMSAPERKEVRRAAVG